MSSRDNMWCCAGGGRVGIMTALGIYRLYNTLIHKQDVQLVICDHLCPDSEWGCHAAGMWAILWRWDHHRIVLSSRCMVGFHVLVGQHLCNDWYHVILLMMGRKFCFFLCLWVFKMMPYWYLKGSFYFFTMMWYSLYILLCCIHTVVIFLLDV